MGREQIDGVASMTSRVPDNFDTPQIDVIIGRIVDGEASRADLDRFAGAASTDINAARRLAEQQRESALLQAAVSRGIDAACRVELPAGETPPRRAWLGASWIREAAPYVGWAAAIVLAIVIGFSETEPPAARVISEESLQPHLLGRETLDTELDPIILQTRQLEDGRYEIFLLRRGVERVILDEFDPDWIRQSTELPLNVEPPES